MYIGAEITLADSPTQSSLWPQWLTPLLYVKCTHSLSRPFKISPYYEIRGKVQDLIDEVLWVCFSYSGNLETERMLSSHTCQYTIMRQAEDNYNRCSKGGGKSRKQITVHSNSEFQSICLQCGRPGFDPWVGKIPWRRKWQPTPVFLPGESHGRRSLVGYSPQGHKQSDTTERLHFHFHRSLVPNTLRKRTFLILHPVLLPRSGPLINSYPNE